MITLNITPEQQEWLINTLVASRTACRGAADSIRISKSPNYKPNAVENLEAEYKFLGVLLEEVSGHPIND